MAVISETTLQQRARDIGFDVTDPRATRISQPAVNAALRHVATMANWRFLEGWERIITTATYSTGAVVVTQNKNTVALATASSADWSGYASSWYGIVINGRPPLLNIISLVGSVESAAYTARAITETDHKWHGATQTAGTYKIHKTGYSMPATTRSIAACIYEDQYEIGIHPDEVSFIFRRDHSDTTGPPQECCLIRNNLEDRYELGVFPFADDEYALSVLVRKWPATLTASGAANTEFPDYFEPLVFACLEHYIYKARRMWTEAAASLAMANQLFPQYKGAVSRYSGLGTMTDSGPIRSIFASGKGADA